VPVKGSYLAIAGGGAILLWSGLKGKSWSTVIRDVLAGKNPVTASDINPINATNLTSSGDGSSGGGSGTVVNTGTAEQILQQTAAQFGWTGSQWTCLYNLEMAEAGFNPKARNPSGAFGLAQALGHGVSGGAAPDGTNEYGGFGLTVAQAVAANSGQPGPQALWMCNYIKAQYGNPCNAWAHEQANHWY